MHGTTSTAFRYSAKPQSRKAAKPQNRNAKIGASKAAPCGLIAFIGIPHIIHYRKIILK